MAVIEHCFTRFFGPGHHTDCRDSLRALIQDIELESGGQLLTTLDYEVVYEVIGERVDGVFGHGK